MDEESSFPNKSKIWNFQGRKLKLGNFLWKQLNRVILGQSRRKAMVTHGQQWRPSSSSVQDDGSWPRGHITGWLDRWVVLFTKSGRKRTSFWHDTWKPGSNKTGPVSMFHDLACGRNTLRGANLIGETSRTTNISRHFLVWLVKCMGPTLKTAAKRDRPDSWTESRLWSCVSRSTGITSSSMMAGQACGRSSI
jgi:hypothetical protein